MEIGMLMLPVLEDLIFRNVKKRKNYATFYNDRSKVIMLCM
jgi:hypothetical protein